MKSVIRKFYDSIKCPICGAPIDSWGRQVGYNYCCSRDFDHYRLDIQAEEYIGGTLTKLPKLFSEEVSVRDKHHVYVILKDHSDRVPYKTAVTVYEIDGEKRIIEGSKIRSLHFIDDIFDFNKFNTEKAIQRIKTIFVFQ